MFKRRRTNKVRHTIDPDEIFLDATNLPRFDTHQFQGRLEKSISKHTLLFLGGLFLVVILLFAFKLYLLQVKNGLFYSALAENNRLQHTPVFPERGVIFDRNGVALAWNESFKEEREYSKRAYGVEAGLAHVVGYVRYPSQDSSGFYIKDTFTGVAGIENFYDEILSGENGLIIVETDALGNIASQSATRPVKNGKNITLAIDERIQKKLYEEIGSLARTVGFNAGAGVIMDIKTGELIALTSFPEYDPAILTGGSEEVRSFINDEREPFLNRATNGLYTPGSIVKPFVALAALNEKVIDPETKILSTGSLSIPHPYFEDRESVFTDWKAHGWVSLREALAVSSNVYFYEVAGGYEEQEGVGIERLEAYFKLLGFGTETGVDLSGEEKGVIPTPSWKKQVFGDEWRVGDTYNTAIGQYGFQITPLQAVRAISAIANDGALFLPRVVKMIDNKEVRSLKKNIQYIDKEHYAVVREGMRLAVTSGTAAGLSLPFVDVAAKTGTAEVGISKKSVNSWVIGFFPYEEPRYAFSVVMEKGPRNNLIGGLFIMRELFLWMRTETPEYLAI
ncbi:MAG: penicillin-binding transpeptidase domain-containing protein [Candidatus Paceibacterota bacterium]